MSAARWEIVRTAAGWHARFKAANNRTVVTTETYKRRRGAENAVEAVTGTFLRGPDNRRVIGYDPRFPVHYVDDRPPPPVLAIFDPIYHKTDLSGFDYWHDHESHHRNCYYEDCIEATPPVGCEIHVRGGVVKYAGRRP